MKQALLPLTVILTAIASIALTSHAFGQSAYDYRSGNSYTFYGTNQAGGVTGHNPRTGSTWSQQWNGGTYTGTDSRGNFYTGNSNTGYYQNWGTGRSCYGSGSARVCY